MSQTACATTATATSFSPWITPAPTVPPSRGASAANAIISRNDGSVNPSHAASPPRQPARTRPIENPSWLLAGPGRNWHSASRSANVS
ncbi:hypothetical protein C7405_10940 [Paraburkholderia caballeronis]|nr:hypothetical protein C7405_10940 [Paraburkholderia caballeronis]